MCFDYSLRGLKEIGVWSTLFIVAACFVAIPIAVLTCMIGALILLPIRIGVSGHYRDADYAAQGWAILLSGAARVLFEYSRSGLQLRVELGKWTVWRLSQPTGGAPDAPGSKAEASRSAKGRERYRGNAHHAGGSEKGEDPVDRVPVETSVSIEKEIFPGADGAPIKPVPAVGSGGGSEASSGPPAKLSLWKQLWPKISRYLEYGQEAYPILVRFLGRLLRIFGFRHVSLDMVYGANDPALTGKLFGYVEAVRPLLGKRATLVLTPDFTCSRLECAGALELSFYLSRLFSALLKMIFRGGLLGGKIGWRERQAKRHTVLREA
jgi:hypothetical protein